MKKFFICISIALLSSLSMFAKGEYDDQLNQLAGEFAGFLVGTPDHTFESCTYTDGMITFVINPNSKIGQAKLADPFAENFYDTLLTKIFSGNVAQGIQIMDFLIGTHTNFCFKIKPNGLNDYMESTVWPGSVKPMLQALQNRQN